MKPKLFTIIVSEHLFAPMQLLSYFPCTNTNTHTWLSSCVPIYIHKRPNTYSYVVASIYNHPRLTYSNSTTFFMKMLVNIRPNKVSRCSLVHSIFFNVRKKNVICAWKKLGRHGYVAKRVHHDLICTVGSQTVSSRN